MRIVLRGNLAFLPIFLLLCFPSAFDLSFFTSVASASPFDYYGFGSRAAGMGNAHTALAEDFSGVYYNPAAMVLSERPSFGLGFVYNHIGLSTTGLTKNGTAFDLQDIDPLHGYSIGICLPLKGNLRGKAAVGIGAFVLGDWYYAKTRSQELNEPEFVVDQVRPRRQETIIALAYRPLSILSFGFGIHLTPHAYGNTLLSLDLPLLRGESGSPPPAFLVNWELRSKLAFAAGIHLNFSEKFRAGLNFRDGIDLLYSIPVDMELTNINILGIDSQTAQTQVTSHINFTPRHINIGLFYAPIPRLSLAADLFWYQWSEYPNPAPTLEIVSDLGTVAIPENPDPDFSDTFTPNFGVEYILSPLITLRGGYSYIPSPVPEQSGETNFLDGDRHLLTLGSGIFFRDPFDLFSRKVRMDVHFQYHLIGGREVRKNTATPDDFEERTNLDGYPYPLEYETSGDIFGAGVTFTLTL